METIKHILSLDPEITLEVSLKRERYGEVEAYLFTHTITHTSKPFPSSLRVAVYRLGPILIDSGSFYDFPLLLPLLEKDPPRHLLLTHHHEDHTGGAPFLLERFPGMMIYAPSQALSYLENPLSLPFYRKLIWGEHPPLTGVRGISTTEDLNLDGYSLIPIPTPGHTPWHLAFLYPGSHSFLFMGDLVTKWYSPLEWYECSIPDKIASLKRILKHAPEPYLLPAHLPPVPLGAETLFAQVAWLKERSLLVQKKVEELGTQDPSRIAQAVFGREPTLTGISAGEFGLKAFVRGVLAPVTHLPAEPLPVGEE